MRSIAFDRTGFILYFGRHREHHVQKILGVRQGVLRVIERLAG